jgi:plastocyanin
VAAVLLAAVPLATPASVRQTAANVTVTMTEFKFGLSARPVPTGAVAFRVVNRGETTHGFQISGRKTPIYSPGKGGTLRVTFRRAGRYPYSCTLPGHAESGMKAC